MGGGFFPYRFFLERIGDSSKRRNQGSKKYKRTPKHLFRSTVLAVAKKMVYIMRSLLKNKTLFDHNYHLLTT